MCLNLGRITTVKILILKLFYRGNDKEYYCKLKCINRCNNDFKENFQIITEKISAPY